MSAAATEGGSGPARRLAGAVVAVATALVITGVTIALFLNPAWVTFAQGRANAAAFTSWTPAQVEAVTRDVVLEVWLGPGTFAQRVGGEPVFNERERAHMVDVRGVVRAFYASALGALAVLGAAALATRGSRWLRRAVALGAGALAVGAVVIGGAFLLFFDTAFTLFHELFFAAGTWTFDPATDRLVQLFPYQFWTETSVAIAVVGLGLTLGVWAAARRSSRPRPGPVAQERAPARAEP